MSSRGPRNSRIRQSGVVRLAFGQRHAVVETEQVRILGRRFRLDEDHDIADETHYGLGQPVECPTDHRLEFVGVDLNRHGITL